MAAQRPDEGMECRKFARRVMAGLVPAIHAAPRFIVEEDARPRRVDARLKAGHDAKGDYAESFAFSCANAQSSQCVSVSTSLASTVAPHQMRRPAGASR